MKKITYLVLNYNRPKETELCLHSIHSCSQFPFQVVLLNNGGDDIDFIYKFYKKGLIDKLILRKENSGCGLGTREIFNDFDICSNYVIYVQCDQWMNRIVTETEVNNWIGMIESKMYFYVDLAGNQGHGNPSERACFWDKNDYNKIYSISYDIVGGPGPYANCIWTEEHLQKYMKSRNLQFYTSPLVFQDNGKNSIREYPCGGILMQETDTKAVHILKPIKSRVDFPNIKLSNEDWDKILNNQWINGMVPQLHKTDSFLVWRKIVGLEDFIIK